MKKQTSKATISAMFILFFIILIYQPTASAPNEPQVIVTLTPDLGTHTYMDYLGNWYGWDATNLSAHPSYNLTENATNYEISKWNSTSSDWDTATLPKRTWLTYDFGFESIKASAKFTKAQANSISVVHNATVSYIPLPWSASKVNMASDALIDMGLIKRNLNFVLRDSNISYIDEQGNPTTTGREFDFELHTIGNEIRIYYRPSDFNSSAYNAVNPLYLNESTITTLQANSTGGNGDYGLMASEAVYGGGYLYDAQGTQTKMNASGLTYVSANDSQYIVLAGSNSADSRWRVNYTITGVQSVQWINATAIINTQTSDVTYIGIDNGTGFANMTGTATVGTNRFVTLIMNTSCSVNTTQCNNLSGGRLQFAISVWTNGGSSNTNTRLDMMTAMVTYTPTSTTTYQPPTPTSNTSTQGADWVNTTWANGTGNVTNSFNVSVNGTWSNLTTTPWTNLSKIPASTWVNVSIYAINNTNGLTQNNTPAITNTYIYPYFTPPVPASNTSTSGADWVNTTWLAGAGNGTNSYNVSVNGTWTNGSATPFYNLSKIPASTWVNVTIFAVNTTGNGKQSLTAAITNTYIYPYFTPPVPASNTSTQGADWVNTTWVAGAGNRTDSYNVSVNGTWTNGSTTPFYNLSSIPLSTWVNVTIYAFNTTSMDALSPTGAITNSYIRPYFVPPVPASNTSTSGADWVNTTWVAGSGNRTDSYNVSVNGTWTNLTTTPFYNLSKIPTATWVNVTIYSFNTTGADGQSPTAAITNTYINPYFTPPVPASNTSTQGVDWVNTTWVVGVGNTTNSYNVSVNGTWTNGTTTPFYNLSSIPSPTWVNVSIYAYNTSGSGRQSLTGAITNTYINPYFTPPVPTGNTSTQGANWVNTTWVVGVGNTTNSYNVSVNGTWTNGTTTPFYNLSSIPSPTWVNVSIYAYNTSGSGRQSLTGAITNTYINPYFTPPVPTGNTSTQGANWVNTTWVVGVGNTTNSYNVSVNGTWTNGTTTPFYNLSSIPSPTWVNVSIYAYNTSGSGRQSLTGAITNTYINPYFTPPVPTGNTSTQGANWVNTTWTSGTGNTTNSYNVSVNGTWTNLTAQNWTNLSNIPSSTWVNVTIFAVNTSGTSTQSLTAAITNTYITISAGFIPPAPTSLANTTGNFWVNHTWSAGAGTITDSYNVSINSTWQNGTTNLFKNSTGMSPHGWANISVYAFNSSAGGTLSTTSATTNTIIPNNPITIFGISSSYNLNESDALHIDANFTDADNDTALFGRNFTNGTFDTATGILDWTAVYGNYSWQMNVTDSNGSISIINFTVRVNDTLPPSQVTGFTNTTTPTATTVGVQWDTATDSGSGIFEYRIERTNESINYEKVNRNIINASGIAAGYDDSYRTIFRNSGGITCSDCHGASYRDNRNNNFWGKFNDTFGYIAVHVTDTNTNSSEGWIDIGFDMNRNGGSAPQTDDNLFRLYKNNTIVRYTGNGTGWALNSTTTTTAVAGAGGNAPRYELRIPLSEIGTITNGTTVRILVEGTGMNQSQATRNDTYYPNGGDEDVPNTWADVTFRNATDYIQMANTSATSTMLMGLNVSTRYNLTVKAVDNVGLVGQRSTPLYIMTEPVTGYNVSGFVKNYLNQPVSGVSVYIGDSQTPTNNTGYFTFMEVTNGTYNWEATKNGYHNITTITINGTDLTNQNLTFEEIVGTPNTLTNTTGNFWVNHTWALGTENTMFNISVNGTWNNGTAITFFNNSGIGAHGSSNIIVWGFNDLLQALSQSSLSDNVIIPNNQPSLTNTTNIIVDEGNKITIDFGCTDADTDTCTYSINRTDLFTDFSTVTGMGTWLTNYSSSGVYGLLVGVSDGQGGIQNVTMTITVNDVATPTYIPPTPIGLANSTGNFWVNHTWSVGTGNVTDSYRIYINGTWNNGTTNLFWNSTGMSAHGWSNISIYAHNSTASGQTSLTGIAENVIIPNNQPSLTNTTNIVVDEGNKITIDFGCTDADTDTCTYSINRTDLFTDFSTVTGMGTWLTNYSSSGVYGLLVGVSDGQGGIQNVTLTLTVNDVATPTYIPPTPIGLANSTGNFWVNHTWSVGTGNVTDSYRIYINGTWNNGTTNLFWNSTGMSAHGWSNISIYAYNTSGATSLTNITGQTIIPNNQPSLTNTTNIIVDEGNKITIGFGCTDADTDTCTYSINRTDLFIDFSTVTGIGTWLTNYSSSGVYGLLVGVSDGQGGIQNVTMTITIRNVVLGIISYSPSSDPTTTSGTAQEFTITLNKTANISWLIDSVQYGYNTSTLSGTYRNSSIPAGVYNVTGSVGDNETNVSRIWTWTVQAATVIVSGGGGGNGGESITFPIFSNPPEVGIEKIITTPQNTTLLLVLTNEGKFDWEYIYEWNLTYLNETSMVYEPIDSRSASKFLKVQESTKMPVEFKNLKIGNYMFRVSANYGEYTSQAHINFRVESTLPNLEKPEPIEPILLMGVFIFSCLALFLLYLNKQQKEEHLHQFHSKYERERRG